jgi:potassium channel subfamily K
MPLHSPIMASFALQAITQVFTRLSNWRLESRREEHGLSVPSPPDDRVITHAEYLAKHHERFDKMFARTDTRESDESDGTAAQKDQDALETVQDQRLVVEMIQRAVALESHARRLLVRHLPNGSRAQVVLKADRNIQLRDLRYLKRSEKDSEGATRQTQQVKAAERAQKPKETELARHARSMAKEEGTDQDPGQLDIEKDPAQLKSELEGDGDEDWVSEPLGEEATLAEVQAYRESFAALLVAGTRLQQLEGQEMYMLERRRPREASSS